MNSIEIIHSRPLFKRHSKTQWWRKNYPRRQIEPITGTCLCRTSQLRVGKVFITRRMLRRMYRRTLPQSLDKRNVRSTPPYRGIDSPVHRTCLRMHRWNCGDSRYRIEYCVPATWEPLERVHNKDHYLSIRCKSLPTRFQCFALFYLTSQFHWISPATFESTL